MEKSDYTEKVAHSPLQWRRVCFMFLLFFLLLPNTFAQEKTISVEGGTEEFPPGPVVENNQSKSQPVQITQNMKLLLYGFVVMVIIGSFAAKKKKPMMHSEEQE